MEKESVKDVILRYGVLLGKRNTGRQKTDFLISKKRMWSSSRIMIRRCGSFSPKSRKPLMRTGQGEISFSIPCCFYAV